MTFEQQIILVLIGGGIGLFSAVIGALISYFLQRRIENDRRKYEDEKQDLAEQAKQRKQRIAILTRDIENLEASQRILSSREMKSRVQMQEGAPRIDSLERENELSDVELGIELLQKMKDIKYQEEIEREVFKVETELRKKKFQLESLLEEQNIYDQDALD